ncbi:GTP-binding protein [Thauera sp. 2A1]|uniref:CobW family GTP-binding protein n=1 Tax=Thauera sp. 2A1 TaxID=2570191 RepID=UPI001290E614|nr:GTP-binding protein [Thauera sp. 2A1]KAI5915155.1 GTP-binding protein [Thauera sp. 2A1]
MTDAGGEDRRIPVTLLTGFLGAGKTTLLNHLLRQPQAAGSAVLINELGTVGIDPQLLDPRLLGEVDETLVVLDSGCICCSVQGDLVRALKGLFMRALRREIPALRRVLIETTGLADPAPVIHTLMAEPFIAERYRCDGVITAVDATHALQQLGAHREAVRQAAMADRLLITKCDLADDAARDAVRQRLAELNPAAPQIEVRAGAADAAAFFGCGLYDAAGKAPDVAAWLGEEAVRAQQAAAQAGRWRRPGALPQRAAADAAIDTAARRHDAGVTSFVLRFDAPLPWFEFSDALGLLLQLHGERILRIKGLLNVLGDPLPRVMQCVQHSVYPPRSLPAWPQQPPFDDRRSRLVFIVRDLPREDVEAMFASFLGQAPT